MSLVVDSAGVEVALEPSPRIADVVSVRAGEEVLVDSPRLLDVVSAEGEEEVSVGRGSVIVDSSVMEGKVEERMHELQEVVNSTRAVEVVLGTSDEELAV